MKSVSTSQWEYRVNLRFEKVPKVKESSLRDLFAVWYIVSDPHVPQNAAEFEFGYS